jgi:thiamine-phosphate pyrophosphorylase
LTQPNDSQKAVFRVIDANLNRLREALRVIEEYFRFFLMDETITVVLKKLRHSLEEIERGTGLDILLSARDTAGDPLANVNRPEELGRTSPELVVCGNFKRGQEAARVLEEYLKITIAPHLSEKAKTLRFSLYDLEKTTLKKLHE